jgi:hypothetical protein
MVIKKMVVVFVLIFVFSCGNKKKAASYPQIPGYEMADPVVIHLKGDLDEISGISYYAKDTSIFAINDERGILYKIYLRKKIEIKKWKFSNDADYEDVAFKETDSSFYVLSSSGNIKSFRFLSGDSVKVQSCGRPLGGNNEFETLYYDKFYGKVVLVCKDCETDDKKTISAYSFNPDDETFSEDPFYQIDTDEVGRLSGSNKYKFKPSAAAIHPITKDLYMVSSVSKSILVADRDGKVKAAYRVDPILFKQPEGITFTPTGDMLISNEFAEIGSATILIFKYKPLINEKG